MDHRSLSSGGNALEHKKEVAAKCDISGCEAEGVRSMPAKKITEALKDKKLKDENAKRAHLCKEHYRQFKKLTKKDKELDRLAW